jgi:hypothetical protein
MTKTLWISTIIAVILVAGSGLAYTAGVTYLPSILMFVAAMIVMGVMMTAEDALLSKYDTPHDEDAHPPQLISLRAGRAIVLITMIVLAVVMLL